MSNKIKLVVLTLLLACMLVGLLALLAPEATATQDSRASRITPVTGTRPDMRVTESPPPTDLDVPTVDTMSQPEFKWF